MELTNDTRNRSGYAEVSGVKLNYTVVQETGKPAESVRADILKNELRIGTVKIEKDGRMYISLDKAGITEPLDQIAIISQAINDSAQVFNELVTE